MKPALGVFLLAWIILFHLYEIVSTDSNIDSHVKLAAFFATLTTLAVWCLR